VRLIVVGCNNAEFKAMFLNIVPIESSGKLQSENYSLLPGLNC